MAVTMPLPAAADPTRVAREWWSTATPARWPEPPAAHGRAALLVPGFLAGDPSLSRLARWLRAGGWATTRSGMAWNVDCMGRALASIERQLEDAVQRAGRPVTIVGQSRGGSFGRVLAVRRPELVDGLVTLGSPVLDQLAVSRRAWPAIAAVGVLGSVGVPGLFRLSCARGACCEMARRELEAPMPAGIDYLALYSRSDEVVRWEACLAPDARTVEVPSSHLGMGLDARAWRVIGEHLAA